MWKNYYATATAAAYSFVFIVYLTIVYHTPYDVFLLRNTGLNIYYSNVILKDILDSCFVPLSLMKKPFLAYRIDNHHQHSCLCSKNMK